MKDYFTLFGKKILENLASVKVWMFLLPFIVSTIFLGWIIYANITGVQVILGMGLSEPYLQFVAQSVSTAVGAFKAWLTFNVSLAGTIVVVREVFKVGKLKNLKNEEDKKKINL